MFLVFDVGITGAFGFLGRGEACLARTEIMSSWPDQRFQVLPVHADDVRREVRERIRVLGRNGVHICGPDHGIMPDVPMENVLAMYDEASKFKF